MRRRAGACVLLAIVVAAAGAGRARADERKRDRKATQEEVDRALDRLNKQNGITTDGPRLGPGTSARDLAARWAEALSTGNQRGLLSIIAREWWASCATPAAREAESERQQAVAHTLGGLAVEIPRGVKLTKAEALSAEKRTKKGEVLDGCVADHELIVQRWRLSVAKGKEKPTTQEFEMIAVDGQWALRAP